MSLFGIGPTHLVTNLGAALRRLKSEYGATFVLEGLGRPALVGGYAFTLLKSSGSDDAARRACGPLRVLGVELFVVALRPSLTVSLELLELADSADVPSSSDVCDAVLDVEGISIVAGAEPDSFITPSMGAVDALCAPTWRASFNAGRAVVGFTRVWELCEGGSGVPRDGLQADTLSNAGLLAQPAASAGYFAVASCVESLHTTVAVSLTEAHGSADSSTTTVPAAAAATQIAQAVENPLETTLPSAARVDVFAAAITAVPPAVATTTAAAMTTAVSADLVAQVPPVFSTAPPAALPIAHLKRVSGAGDAPLPTEETLTQNQRQLVPIPRHEAAHRANRVVEEAAVIDVLRGSRDTPTRSPQQRLRQRGLNEPLRGGLLQNGTVPVWETNGQPPVEVQSSDRGTQQHVGPVTHSQPSRFPIEFFQPLQSAHVPDFRGTSFSAPLGYIEQGRCSLRREHGSVHHSIHHELPPPSSPDVSAAPDNDSWRRTRMVTDRPPERSLDVSCSAGPFWPRSERGYTDDGDASGGALQNRGLAWFSDNRYPSSREPRLDHTREAAGAGQWTYPADCCMSLSNVPCLTPMQSIITLLAPFGTLVTLCVSSAIGAVSHEASRIVCAEFTSRVSAGEALVTLNFASVFGRVVNAGPRAPSATWPPKEFGPFTYATIDELHAVRREVSRILTCSVIIHKLSSRADIPALVEVVSVHGRLESLWLGKSSRGDSSQLVAGAQFVSPAAATDALRRLTHFQGGVIDVRTRAGNHLWPPSYAVGVRHASAAQLATGEAPGRAHSDLVAASVAAAPHLSHLSVPRGVAASAGALKPPLRPVAGPATVPPPQHSTAAPPQAPHPVSPPAAAAVKPPPLASNQQLPQEPPLATVVLPPTRSGEAAPPAAELPRVDRTPPPPPADPSSSRLLRSLQVGNVQKRASASVVRRLLERYGELEALALQRPLEQFTGVRAYATFVRAADADAALRHLRVASEAEMSVDGFFVFTSSRRHYNHYRPDGARGPWPPIDAVPVPLGDAAEGQGAAAAAAGKRKRQASS